MTSPILAGMFIVLILAFLLLYPNLPNYISDLQRQVIFWAVFPVLLIGVIYSAFK